MINSQDLTNIPGVGPSIAGDLQRLGITQVHELVGQDPQQLYDELGSLGGRVQDPCVLYVFRCAVYFAETPNPEPDKLLWWNWKD